MILQFQNKDTSWQTVNLEESQFKRALGPLSLHPHLFSFPDFQVYRYCSLSFRRKEPQFHQAKPGMQILWTIIKFIVHLYALFHKAVTTSEPNNEITRVVCTILQKFTGNCQYS